LKPENTFRKVKEMGISFFSGAIKYFRDTYGKEYQTSNRGFIGLLAFLPPNSNGEVF